MTDQDDSSAILAARWEARKADLRRTFGEPTDAIERLSTAHPTAMAAVLGHLRPKLSDYEVLAFLDHPDVWACLGRRPVDLLGLEDDAVIEAARYLTVDDKWY